MDLAIPTVFSHVISHALDMENVLIDDFQGNSLLFSFSIAVSRLARNGLAVSAGLDISRPLIG